MSDKPLLGITEQDQVTIIDFLDPLVLDAYHVQQVSKQLLELMEKPKCLRFVVDLSAIKMLSSRTLGVFLDMRQKLQPMGGKMVICGIDPQLYRVFKVTSLDTIFDFFSTRQEALDSFKNT